MPTSVINKIKQFLSGKIVSWAILVLVIAGRIIQLIYFYNVRSDASFQVIATQNFVNGHAISTAKVLASDLSTTIYEPLINWPPGFSLLLAPFYVLFNHNYIAAGLTLSVISGIILLLYSRSILKVLHTPVYLMNVYTLFTGLFIYYFYFICCSDAVAIAFFIAGLYYTLSFLQSDQRRKLKFIGIVLPLLISAYLKYLFMPVVFVIPGFLLIKGWTNKNKAVKKAGVLSLAFLSGTITGLLVYQKLASGSATYISESTRGFFPENLDTAYPVFPASFINPGTLSLALNSPAEQGSLIFYILQWIYILFLVIISILFVWMIYKRGIQKTSLAGSFQYLAGVTSAGVILLLAVLSLSVAKEAHPGESEWTYVEEPRYYGLVTVLLQLAVFALYKYYKGNLSKYVKHVFYFFLLLLLPDMFRGANFIFQRIKNFNKEEYSWQHDHKFQQYADAIIKKEQLLNPVGAVVVTGPLYYQNNRVSIYNQVPVLKDAGKINYPDSLNSKETTLLLVILDDKDLQNFRPFLSKKGSELKGHFDTYNFYTLLVTPHSFNK